MIKDLIQSNTQRQQEIKWNPHLARLEWAFRGSVCEEIDVDHVRVGDDMNNPHPFVIEVHFPLVIKKVAQE
jgi:hypothetical protein